jgi:alkylation response protein AidB-like acyl-CoA dehydrogenase
MPPTLPFWIAFVTTVLLLVASVTTGALRRRRVHLFLGPATIVSLGVAIVLTEQLMGNYAFPPDELAFHLVFAKAGGLLALPVIVTGVWLARSERARAYHRVAVAVWILSVLAATGTGLWMFSHGALKAG